MSDTNGDNQLQNSEEKIVLTEQQQAAVSLRYEGKTYEAISKLIEVPAATLRGWFSPAQNKRGVYEAYCKYADEQNEVSKEMAGKRLGALLDNAVDAIAALVEYADKDSTRLAAAEVVVERALGKVTQNVNLVGTEQLKENADLLKKLAGIKPNADNTGSPGVS